METTSNPSLVSNPSPQPQPPQKSSSDILFLIVVILIVALTLCGVIGVFAYKKTMQKQRAALQQRNEQLEDRVEDLQDRAQNRPSRGNQAGSDEAPEDEPKEPSETNEPEPGEPSGDGIETYVNAEYNLSFDYPSSFAVTEDGVLLDYPGMAMQWYRVILKNESDAQNPMLTFEINPDGYGPIFLDKTYVLVQNSDGSIAIASEQDEPETELNDDGVVRIGAQFQNGDSTTYNWRFEYEEGPTDWEPTFKEILTSTVLP